MAASVSDSPSLSRSTTKHKLFFSATFSLSNDETQFVPSLRRDPNTTKPYHGRFSFKVFKSFQVFSSPPSSSHSLAVGFSPHLSCAELRNL
ncbi:hypothetical protein P8452_57356 [Trifolium repens]|nr:hypothetical protein P8452_57356 [Trifolium repens]